jgi:hypothetical protein
MQELIERLRGYLREGGRDPATFGIEARVSAGDGELDVLIHQTKRWQELGATHICINTMGAGFTSLQQHLEVIRRYKEAFGKLS